MAAEFAKDSLREVNKRLADADIYLTPHLLLKLGSLLSGVFLLIGGGITPPACPFADCPPADCPPLARCPLPLAIGCRSTLARPALAPLTRKARAGAAHVCAAFSLALSRAGVLGTTAMLFGGGFAYVIGSFYAIVFGVMVVVVELQKSERWEYIAYAYEWIDIYLKFMTLQRGKGMFYLGVGALVFFIGPEGHSSNWVQPWGVNNVAALCLAAMGVIHTLQIVKERGASSNVDGTVTPNGFQLTGVSEMDFNSPYAGPPAAEESVSSKNPFLQRS